MKPCRREDPAGAAWSNQIRVNRESLIGLGPLRVRAADEARHVCFAVLLYRSVVIERQFVIEDLALLRIAPGVVAPAQGRGTVAGILRRTLRQNSPQGIAVGGAFEAQIGTAMRRGETFEPLTVL